MALRMCVVGFVWVTLLMFDHWRWLVAERVRACICVCASVCVCVCVSPYHLHPLLLAFSPLRFPHCTRHVRHPCSRHSLFLPFSLLNLPLTLSLLISPRPLISIFAPLPCHPLLSCLNPTLAPLHRAYSLSHPAASLQSRLRRPCLDGRRRHSLPFLLGDGDGRPLPRLSRIDGRRRHSLPYLQPLAPALAGRRTPPYGPAQVPDPPSLGPHLPSSLCALLGAVAGPASTIAFL